MRLFRLAAIVSILSTLAIRTEAQPVSSLPQANLPPGNADLFEITQSIGGVFQSRKISFSQLLAGVPQLPTGGAFTVGDCVSVGSINPVTLADAGQPCGTGGGGGGIVQIFTGNGIGGGPIGPGGSGTIVLLPVTGNTVLSNNTGSSTTPIPNTLTSIIDADICNSQGSILYRNATVWVCLTAGTNGQVLTTGGANANPAWGTVTGTGTVTSAALTMPNIFSVGGSPITTTGTFAVTLATENANLVWAGPASGGAAAPTFRSLVGADLPNPSATTLGGIRSFAAVTHQWINAISTSGIPSSTQPACGDLSDSTGGCNTPIGLSGAVLGLLNANLTLSGADIFSGTTVTFLHGIIARIAILTSGSSYTFDSGTITAGLDYLVCVNKASGSATSLTLPSTPATGRIVGAGDCKGDAATNNITVNPAAGNIDGSPNFIITSPFGINWFMYTGTFWKST